MASLPLGDDSPTIWKDSSTSSQGYTGEPATKHQLSRHAEETFSQTYVSEGAEYKNVDYTDSATEKNTMAQFLSL